MNDHTPPSMPPYPSSGGGNPYQPGGLGSADGVPNNYPSDNNYLGPNDGAYGPNVPMTQGTGKVKIFNALGWGFKSTFERPAWIGFTFLAGFIMLVVIGAALFFAIWPVIGWTIENPEADSSMIPADIAHPNLWLYYIVTSLCIAIFTTLFVSAAVKTVNGQRLSFGDFFRPKNGLWTFITVFVLYMTYSLFEFLTDSTTTVQESSGDVSVTSSLAAESSLPSLIPMLLLIFLVPLLIFLPYVWQDTGCGFLDGIKTAVAIGGRNYFPLLGYYLLMVLISIVAVIPIGLGMLIVAPAQALATALLYRQALGGMHPQT